MRLARGARALRPLCVLRLAYRSMPGFHAVRLLKAKEVAFCSVMDLGLVEAFSFQWRSWAWQRKHVPTALQKAPLVVRAIQDSEVMPLVKLVATNGW